MGGMSATPGADPEGGEREDHPGAGRLHDGDGDVLRVQGRRHRLPDRDVRRPDGGQGHRGVAAGDDAGLVRGTDQREQPDGQHEQRPGADAIVWVVGTNGQLNALNADTGASLLSGAAISLGTVKPHQSPIVANGRVIAASDNRIYALTP